MHKVKTSPTHRRDNPPRLPASPHERMKGLAPPKSPRERELYERVQQRRYELSRATKAITKSAAVQAIIEEDRQVKELPPLAFVEKAPTVIHAPEFVPAVEPPETAKIDITPKEVPSPTHLVKKPSEKSQNKDEATLNDVDPERAASLHLAAANRVVDEAYEPTRARLVATIDTPTIEKPVAALPENPEVTAIRERAMKIYDEQQRSDKRLDAETAELMKFLETQRQIERSEAA